METLWQHLRYGARMMLRRPAVTAVLVITLALGIGANAAIFSVVDAVLLRPLPYEDPEELVNLYEYHLAKGYSRFSISIHNFTDWRNQSGVFESMAAYNYRSANLTGDVEPRWVTYVEASDNLFHLLRVAPILGRSFRPEDGLQGNNTIILLSHRFWKDHFGGDPTILGKPIELHGISHTVVGVMPASFEFPSPEVELWRPMLRDPALYNRDRSSHFARAIGRLESGATLEQAQVEMDTLAARLARSYPESNEGWGVTVESLHYSMVTDIRAVLLILWAAVGLVLLIACSNVANLLLAQTVSREKEMAIRAALGAGRISIVLQTLTETVLLAFVSGAAGVLVAFLGVRWLPRLAGESLPQFNEVWLDWRVLAFTALATLITGILLGLVPSLQGSRTDLNASLAEGGRTSVPGLRGRFRNLLVVSEVAVALVLLISASLVMVSFMNLWRNDAGFDPSNLLTFRYSLPSSSYSTNAHRSAFHRQLVDRIGALPEVESAAVISNLPLEGDYDLWSFTIEGRPEEDTKNANTMIRRISPGYFRTMRIPSLKGRVLTSFDRAEGDTVMIISKAMASKYWPSADPIGKTLRFSGPPVLRAIAWRIIGIVEDVPSSSLEVTPRPTVYVPYDQFPFSISAMSLALRTGTDPAQLERHVRAVVAAADKNLPIFNVRTMEEIRGESVARRRFGTLLIGLFAAVAVVLAVVGIYGTISYAVGQRTREIGIRMAVGAQKRDILEMVVRHGLALTGAGIVVGLAGAFALTRYLSSLLFGLSHRDTTTFVAVSFLLIVVGVLAAYVPARRAAKTDPIAALHYE
jgi:putative ABC transport system permease protein